jgi:poly-gamma-glutamate synthesis protein (capsule biosynthesis protein)
MNLIAPESMAQGLQFAGFDVITVATNHIKDCGDEGYRCNDQSFFDTLDAITSLGIKPVGGGRNLSEARQPVILEKQGIRFAFLGIDQINSRVWATENTPGVAPISEEYLVQVKADIKSAKAAADVVIVLPQWGTEYASIPDPYQRQWAQEFINAGAALVVGNHPHIIQPVESFDNGLAFYALGNFVFDQGQNHRREGVALQVTFNGTELADWQLIPVNINYYTHQPNWADGEDAVKILARAPDLSP